jgi:hypothetical protein
VRHRHRAYGDRHEAREAALRREQVVAEAVEPAVGDVVARWRTAGCRGGTGTPQSCSTLSCSHAAARRWARAAGRRGRGAPGDLGRASARRSAAPAPTRARLCRRRAPVGRPTARGCMSAITSACVSIVFHRSAACPSRRAREGPPARRPPRSRWLGWRTPARRSSTVTAMAAWRMSSVSRSPRAGARHGGRLVHELQQRLLQGEQVPGEVAAVHRRDVAGRQRRQRGRVVPVVEVAAVALHRLEGPQRGLERGRAARTSPIQPMSCAATADSRYRPMLVGDVRWATTGCGSSWKLSGGRWCSAAVTQVVEVAPGPTGREAQVARVAVARGGERARACGEVLRARAVRGAVIQSRLKATATPAASGARSGTAASVAAPSATPGHIFR